MGIISKIKYKLLNFHLAHQALNFCSRGKPLATRANDKITIEISIF